MIDKPQDGELIENAALKLEEAYEILDEVSYYDSDIAQIKSNIADLYQILSGYSEE